MAEVRFSGKTPAEILYKCVKWLVTEDDSEDDQMMIMKEMVALVECGKQDYEEFAGGIDKEFQLRLRDAFDKKNIGSDYA